MRVSDYLFVVLIGNVIEFVENLLVYVLLLRGRLRLQRKILSDSYFSCVEEFLHDAHEFDKFFADDLKAHLAISPCEHLDIAIEELSYFLNTIKGKAQIILLNENVEDIVLVDTEYAAEVGL
jgi:dsDNA-binding SOS-regulon protein